MKNSKYLLFYVQLVQYTNIQDGGWFGGWGTYISQAVQQPHMIEAGLSAAVNRVSQVRIVTLHLLIHNTHLSIHPENTRRKLLIYLKSRPRGVYFPEWFFVFAKKVKKTKPWSAFFSSTFQFRDLFLSNFFIKYWEKYELECCTVGHQIAQFRGQIFKCKLPGPPWTLLPQPTSSRVNPKKWY